MRPRLRPTTAPAFLVGSLASSALLLALACGGGAKAPAGPAGSSATAATGPAATGASTASGQPTTTTSTLADAGDLQGAKLTTASRTELEDKAPGQPKPAAASSEQGRSAKDLQAIIGARRDEARACYDKGLKDHPGIEGDLDVKWIIDPQGNVMDVSVDTARSQILEPSVGACVVEIIKKIRFASSPKGHETRAHYPFNFHPRNPTAKADAGK
jgi:hypothetical protein